jgi:hypothetical protein
MVITSQLPVMSVHAINGEKRATNFASRHVSGEPLLSALCRAELATD